MVISFTTPSCAPTLNLKIVIIRKLTEAEVVFKEDEEDVEDAVVDEEDNKMKEEENKITKFSQNKVIKTTLLIQTSLKIPPLAIIQMFQIATMHNYATKPSPVSYKYKGKVRNYATNLSPVSYKFKGKIRIKSRFKQ